MSSYGDLYRLTAEQLTPLKWVEELGPNLAKTIIDGIEESKNFGLGWLLMALRPAKVKKKHVQALANHFHSLEKLMRTDVIQLSRIDEIGFASEIVYGWLHNEIGEATFADLREVGVCLEPVPTLGKARRLDATNVSTKDGLQNDIANIKENITRFVSVKEKVTDQDGNPRERKKGFAGLGETRVHRLVEEGLVRKYSDLYRLHSKLSAR